MGNSLRPDLSPAQREIMEIVWDKKEASVQEVRESLNKERNIARETVRTLLTRMEEKGWLRHRVVGRTFLYSAAIPRDANLGQRLVEFIDTLCDGSAETLMTALLNHRGLTDAETRRIQAMLRDAKKNQSRRK